MNTLMYFDLTEQHNPIANHIHLCGLGKAQLEEQFDYGQGTIVVQVLAASRNRLNKLVKQNAGNPSYSRPCP